MKMCRMFAINLREPEDVTDKVMMLIGKYAYGNKDGFGYAYLDDQNEIKLFKSGCSANEYLLNNKIERIFTRSIIVHLRFSTTSKGGKDNAHPFVSEDGKLACCHNGWLRNWEKAKEKLILEGHEFSSSKCDSEVMLHLFEKYGKNCVNYAEEKYDVSANGSKRNFLFLKDDGTVVGISDDSLSLTRIENGFMLSSDNISDISEEIKEGISITLNEGKAVDRRRIFGSKKKEYNSYITSGQSQFSKNTYVPSKYRIFGKQFESMTVPEDDEKFDGWDWTGIN